MMDAFDRETDYLEEQLAEGVISQAEFNKQMNDLQYEYRAAADEAIYEAGQNEARNWYG